jgi:single-stranded DNA-binding protein
MIKATLVGTLGRDARSFGEDGAGLTLACERYDFKAKEKVTTWVDVTVWGKRGEWARKLTKGEALVVSGDVFLEEYEKDGVKRTKMVCHAQSVDYVPSGQRAST